MLHHHMLQQKIRQAAAADPTQLAAPRTHTHTRIYTRAMRRRRPHSTHCTAHTNVRRGAGPAQLPALAHLMSPLASAPGSAPALLAAQRHPQARSPCPLAAHQLKPAPQHCSQTRARVSTFPQAGRHRHAAPLAPERGGLCHRPRGALLLHLRAPL